jgi:serine protease Do
VTPDAAEKFGYKETATGALIAKVEPESVAAQAGLRRGMLIVKVEKKAIKTAAAAQTELNKASLDKGILLQVQTPQGGGTSYLVLKAEPASK